MTLTELIAQVRMATLVDTTAVSDATITLLLNQGIHEVSLASQWPWLEEAATINLVADDRDYTLPAGFDLMVAVVDDDNDRTIPYVAPANFFHMFGNDTGNTSDTPQYYTIYESLILFAPIPSANDTARITCYYYKQPTELSAGGDIPGFHEAFHYILVEYVKWKVWENQEYFDQSERAFVTFARYLSQMISWYQRRAKMSPFIAGDGVRYRYQGDPNIPFLGLN